MELRKRHAPDYWLLAALALLLIGGLAVLASASSVISLEKYGNSYYKLKQQLFHGILPGLVFFFLFFRLNYQNFKKWAVPFLLGGIFLLTIVLIPHIGFAHGEARSWLKIGPLFFQPAEVIKLFLIIYLALWFSQRPLKKVQSFTDGFLPFSILLGLIVGLILLQPDLGTAIIVSLIGVAMYFFGGAAKKHLFLLAVLAFLAGILFFKFAPAYQRDRLISFLNPQYDVQGIGYHINQAFLAIGSGQLWGLGFGQSRQKFLYLPEVANDSIFAIFAEEMGFFSCCLFLLLLVFIIWRSLKVAQEAPDKFSSLVVLGVISWFTIQTIINIGSITGLLPLTGVTLPLVSYGGSSMVVLLAAFGLVLNISCYT